MKSFVKYLLEQVNSLAYDDEPNYQDFHKKINDTLKFCGYSNDDDFRNINVNDLKIYLRLVKFKEKEIFFRLKKQHQV